MKTKNYQRREERTPKFVPPRKFVDLRPTSMKWHIGFGLPFGEHHEWLQEAIETNVATRLRDKWIVHVNGKNGSMVIRRHGTTKRRNRDQPSVDSVKIPRTWCPVSKYDGV